MQFDVVIIGAGIAGLSAAWQLRDNRILVLEAADRVGGRIWSEQRDQYWLNFGAHLFGEANSPVGKLLAEFGLESRPIAGHRFGIAYRGKVIAGGPAETFPLRLPLSLGARLSFMKMGIKLRTGVQRLLAFQRFVSNDDPAERRSRLLAFDNSRTFAEYIGPLHADVQHILETITERTSASPEKMAAGYGLASFGQVWSRHSFGRNLYGGSARLPNAMLAELGDRVQLRCQVSAVTAKPLEVEVDYARDGEHHRVVAKYVIVATQADVAKNIIKDLPSDTAAALGRIRYGPFLSAAVLTRESGAMPWDSNYAIATPGLSFGVFFNQASTVRVGPRRPGGSLMLFRGAEGAARLMNASDLEIESSFLGDLEKLFPEARGIVREIKVQRWPQGAPYSFVGRAALQSALTRPLGRVFLAGDYLEFPCMDAAVTTGGHAAKEVQAALGQFNH